MDIQTQNFFTPEQLLQCLPSPARCLYRNHECPSFITSVCDDSRMVGEGSLFVCIRGDKFDGHDFILDAYRRGCRHFLVQTLPSDRSLPRDASLWISQNTRRDMAYLSANLFGNPAEKMKLVGITGTKGKTTTALLCYHILSCAGVAVGYIGTGGVWYGTTRMSTTNTTPGPLQLHRHLADMYRAGIRVVLLEVSSQAVWQERIASLRFSIAVFTNLSPDHIGPPEHPDFSHYLSCKHMLFTDYGATTVIVNADDPHAEEMLQGVTADVIRFGVETANLTFSAEQLQEFVIGKHPEIRFLLRDSTKHVFPVSLPLPGKYNAYNALCALAIVSALGVSTVLAVSLLSDATVPGRGETFSLPNGALVVVDYAHNGIALRSILSALRTLSPRKLYCLFGSVGGRTACRRPELGQAAAELADFSFLTADNPDSENVIDICRDIAAAYPNGSEGTRYCIIPDRKSAIAAALQQLKGGDVLLLAGKGDEQYQLINGEKIPYNDRAIIQRYLSEMFPLTPV